jgi:hypothetical protein
MVRLDQWKAEADKRVQKVLDFGVGPRQPGPPGLDRGGTVGATATLWSTGPSLMAETANELRLHTNAGSGSGGVATALWTAASIGSLFIPASWIARGIGLVEMGAMRLFNVCASSAKASGPLPQIGKFKFLQISTRFGGPHRPTFRGVQSPWIRVESHPISAAWPGHWSYPHMHIGANTWLGSIHIPIVQPAIAASLFPWDSYR